MTPKTHLALCADTLRYARERAGLSLRAAAARAGIAPSSLFAYERGVRSPPAAPLFEILESLGQSVRIELEPRIRERNGVPRGEELVQVIRLAEQFPPRHRPEIKFLSILEEAKRRNASASADNEASVEDA